MELLSTRMRTGMRLVAVAVVAGVAACSSHVVRLPVVPDPSRAATVTVVRESGIFGGYGAAVRRQLFVDGYTVAQMGPGMYLTFKLAPGTHSIGTPNANVALNFEPDSAYFFKMAVSLTNSTIGLERMTPERAQTSIKNAKRIPTP